MLCTRILTMIYFKVHKKSKKIKNKKEKRIKQCYLQGISMYGDLLEISILRSGVLKENLPKVQSTLNLEFSSM